jgi:hypothetical protein
LDLVLILRIFITLTFLILAVGGPIAIMQLRRFARVYYIQQGELKVSIEALERRVARLEPSAPDGKY